ncbi:hypothetical protein CMUS01_14132 [Colletotrichum musicola]|uniref:Uncharacterized protein n=1 Tax=Colletotrichum musicola TaxID=2175873 RepID=A0A8H6J6W3_9PEZI|nr:hypothetical protein CMUS01_14132 [Colletotrichum musicola]
MPCIVGSVVKTTVRAQPQTCAALGTVLRTVSAHKDLPFPKLGAHRYQIHDANKVGSGVTENPDVAK